jgi:hypothetical protein
MWALSQLTKEERLRLRFIIEMGLTWSRMMRVFDKGTKKKLHDKIMHDFAEKVFNIGSREEFVKIHTDFCDWGTNYIDQAERKGRRQKDKASYGQIAKTLDVTLKVAVYYCHLPDCEQSRRICRWLNAAVDTAMMRELKKDFPSEMRPWPTLIKDVNKEAYYKIQSLVHESIKREHNNAITCPQWEDIHWVEANE